MVKGMHLTPIGGGKVLLEPSEGLDPANPDDYLMGLAESLRAFNALQLLYDLKNVPLVDRVYYDWLRSLYSLCRISGVELVAINMQPAAAYALAMAINETPPFVCALDVDSVG